MRSTKKTAQAEYDAGDLEIVSDNSLGEGLRLVEWLNHEHAPAIFRGDTCTRLATRRDMGKAGYTRR